MRNRIIKPNEDLRGTALVECAVPKMQSPSLIEGATLYRCYLEPQDTPNSVADVCPTTVLDVYQTIQWFEGLDGEYVFEDFTIDFKDFEDIVGDLDGNAISDAEFTRCHFLFGYEGIDYTPETIEFRGCVFRACTFKELKKYESYFSFHDCKFEDSFVFKGKASESLYFFGCEFIVKDLSIHAPNSELDFGKCLSNVKFPVGENVNSDSSVALTNNSRVVKNLAYTPQTFAIRKPLDWDAKNSDLRCLDLRFTSNAYINGSNFQGSVFGGFPYHRLDYDTTHYSASYIRLSGSFRGGDKFNLDYKPIPSVFEHVNFSNTLIDQMYIGFSKTSNFTRLRQRSIPIFNVCDFSQSTLGLIATLIGVRQIHKSVPSEVSQSNISFRECNFEDCVSYYRPELIRANGGHYIGDNSENDGLDLSGRKLLGQFRNTILRNTDLSDCTWYTKIFLFQSDFEGCDFSGLRLAEYVEYGPAKHDFITLKANLKGCTFNNLPKGFSLYLSPLCNTDGASFDPNIEWSTNEDGFRLGIVV